MTNIQENKLRMYKTVNALLGEHGELTDTVQAFAEMRSALGTLIDRINASQTEFRASTAGKTTLKYDARDTL